jgi:hypothetical protein
MFDKTHSLATIASYEIIEGLIVSATFLYSTGSPITLPEAYYSISGVLFPYWEGRNKYRLPDYHRLDLGLNYEPEFLTFNISKRKIKTGLEISVYNVYNRRNVRAVDFGLAGGGKGASGIDEPETIYQQYGISTYGFMPSFQLDFRF